MFKNLKRLFVIEDEESKSANSGNSPKTNDSDNKSSKGKTTVNTPKVEPTPIKGTGSPEDKFIDRLLGALEENNIEGFDYLEYKQALQNLGKMDMDEATQYKSAMAMASTMGANAEKLISSAQHYVKILKKEEVKFVDAFKGHQEKQVASQEQNFTNLEKAIVQKEQKVIELKKEIEQHKKELENKKTAVNQANAKSQSTKENFYASYNIVINQIIQDIEKMKNYLK